MASRVITSKVLAHPADVKVFPPDHPCFLVLEPMREPHGCGSVTGEPAALGASRQPDRPRPCGRSGCRLAPRAAGSPVTDPHPCGSRMGSSTRKHGWSGGKTLTSAGCASTFDVMTRLAMCCCSTARVHPGLGDRTAFLAP